LKTYVKSKIIPIEGNHEEVEHAGVGGKVVEREPHVADVGAKRPIAEQQVDGVERHGDGADGDVGDGQRQQEVVGDGLQLLVDLE